MPRMENFGRCLENGTGYKLNKTITMNIQTTTPNSNFIKAMIKIANPDWSPEQIEAEAQKKLQETIASDDNCEFCSS